MTTQEFYSTPERVDTMDVCLLLGRIMFHNGATVQRIIDSMNHLQAYFGGNKIHVLVTYDAIVVTDIKGDRFHTKIDQNLDFAGTNIAVLTAIRTLLKDLPKTGLSAEALKQELMEISKMKSTIDGIMQHVVFGLTGVSFGILNNADIWAGCSVFLSSMMISRVKTLFMSREYNLFVSILIAALSGTILSCLFVKLMPTITPLVAIIAPVLPMIPGFPLINGGIDILRNHNSVGLARIAFAAMLISTLTLAIAGPLVLFFGTLENPLPVAHGTPSMLIRYCISGSCAAVLLGMIFNAPRHYLWMFGLGGAATLLIRTFCFLFLRTDLVTATFFAAAGITVIAFILSRRHLLPPVLFAVICVLTMTPGYLIVSGLNDCFALSKMAVKDIPYELLLSAAHTLMRAALIVFAMISGVVFPILILEGRSARI